MLRDLQINVPQGNLFTLYKFSTFPTLYIFHAIQSLHLELPVLLSVVSDTEPGIWQSASLCYKQAHPDLNLYPPGLEGG